MYSKIVRTVINAEEGIKQSITQQDKDLLWLLHTPSCRRCVEFIESHGRYPLSDDQEKRYLGGRLLLILTALQNASKHIQREQLSLLGVRKFAYECRRSPRRRLAALEREKPLRDTRHYVEKHLPRIEMRIAGELEALVEHPEVLEAALRRNGMTAILKYL